MGGIPWRSLKMWNWRLGRHSHYKVLNRKFDIICGSVFIRIFRHFFCFCFFGIFGGPSRGGPPNLQSKHPRTNQPILSEIGRESPSHPQCHPHKEIRPAEKLRDYEASLPLPQKQGGTFRFTRWMNVVIWADGARQHYQQKLLSKCVCVCVKCVSSWWFQPIWKNIRQIGIISPSRGENKKNVKPPTRCGLFGTFVFPEDVFFWGCIYYTKKSKTECLWCAHSFINIQISEELNGIQKGKNRWHSYHVLVYINHVLTCLLGTVSHVLWPLGIWW